MQKSGLRMWLNLYMFIGTNPLEHRTMT